MKLSISLAPAAAPGAAGLACRAIAAVALVALAACGGDRDPISTVTNGSIRGSVTDNTGASVASAAIALTGNAQAARTTTSGADGAYAFANLPAGTYSLAVTAPNGFAVGATGTTSVTVAAGTQATASAFVLNRVISNGSIRGTITDVDASRGVANAAVALTGNGQAERITSSSANGVYTFADLPPGTYSLAVTPPGGFTFFGTGTPSVTVPNGAQGDASPIVLRHDSCLVARPNFGVATAEDRALYSYDASAPLNLQKTLITTNTVFQSSTITYTSPAGGTVPGIMVEPVGRSGLRPAILIMHPSGVPSAGMLPYAQQLAANGAVVIAIDAPYFRRAGTSMWLFTSQDRIEAIQLIKDLQRAVDVLRAHPDVDDERIGFEGYSYGGIIGSHFVGIEHRIKAAVLAAAHGGHVTGATTGANLGYMSASLTCAERNAWFRSMVPIEGIRFTGNAAPTELLFQIARFDTAVLLADAQALYKAASGPKEVLYYDTGHGFNPQALYDRHFWFHQKLGIDPPQALP